MDGWAETYYRTEEDFATQKNKVLPYVVNCESKEKIESFTARLKEEGYTYAATVTGLPSTTISFLVNTQFKKYAKVPYPARFDCVNNRIYSIDEFIENFLEHNK
ncbi:MAG: hypothetical protein J5965_20425 [Aeriscardovia sp.]|nr:hypothetical protein [Aeriscardovia sp.]